MSTIALDITTAPYPTIANNIETRIYLQSDPLAIVASLNYAAPHLERVWAFPGLTRANYLFRIFEMSGSAIVRQLGGDMDVNPSSAPPVAFKITEQVCADLTPNFTSGVNVATFDGTGGGPDWRGWDISTLDRIGTGPMKKNIDYTWNKTTGVLTLLQPGDLFGPNEWFNVDFTAQTQDVTDSVPTTVPLFSTPKLITANYPVSAGGDMGGVLILDPTGNYLEVQLPHLDTVVAGKLLTIEMRRASVNKCGKLITWPGQTIDWLQGGRGDLYICPQETISLYKFIDPSGPTSMWRVLNPNGNWLRLGEQVTDDNVAANVVNKVLMAGADGDILALARIYNDYVTQLGAQVCNYDDWTTGNNKYKFSLANSTVPANAGKFKIPDRRNTTDKNTDGTILPGVFQAASVGAFPLTLTGIKMRKSGTSNMVVVMANISDADLGTQAVNFGTVNTGVENRVNGVITRKYLLV